VAAKIAVHAINRHPHREEPPKGAGGSPGKRAIVPYA